MYELGQVAENTYYINAPSKIGVYRVSDDDVWLIDSGNDKDAGRKIQKILDAQGWKLTAIINTHSNADHDGGNTLLQNRLNCPVYTTPMSHPSFTAAIPSRSCGINSSWQPPPRDRISPMRLCLRAWNISACRGISGT